MKKRIKLIPIIVLMVIQFSSYGQMERANRYFDLYRFAKAIPLYEKVVKHGKEADQRKATIKIADCYRLLNNAIEARSWYARVVEITGIEPINYFYLGCAQMELENYTDAKTSFEHYGLVVPNDVRGKQYAVFCEWAEKNKAVTSNSEIKNMKSLNTQWSDFSPVLYKDGIVFTSDRISSAKTDIPYKWTGNGYLDLYTSQPRYFKDYWSDMTEAANLNKGYQQMYHDGPAAFSKDGKFVVISRTNLKNVKIAEDKIKTHVVKLFYADIEEGVEPKFKPFFINSDEYSVAHATLSADGKTMIFSSDKPNGYGESDLYICKRDKDSWGYPANLGQKINTFGNEVFPYLVNDTTLLFSSNGHPGYGGLDIFISYKKDTSWTEPKNLMKPINSSYDDFGILMFDDLKSGFFSSNRPDGVGLDDIYAFRAAETNVAEKQTEVQLQAKTETGRSLLTGYVKDKITNLPLDNATVFVCNMQNGKISVLKTDENGLYKTYVDQPANYLVKAMQTNYIADCFPWTLKTIYPDKTLSAYRDLILDKLDLNKTLVYNSIYYDFDKYLIRDDAKPELNKIIKIMQDNPNIIAELSSHTDSRGKADYNMMLSQNRANAAVDYIINTGGLMPGRMIAKGYGETKLTNKCKDGVKCTDEEHQMNRRTEFKVIGINQVSVKGQFDPGKYIAGEIIDVKSLPDFFFNPCDETYKEKQELSIVKPEDVINSQPDIIVRSNAVNMIKQQDQETVVVKEKPVDVEALTQYHIVVAGETLYSIANKYNMPVQKLIMLNKLQDNDKISAGQKLIIN
jgi:outer membrane protein OmpA-like peptidoglycan-associated protein/LysM repeat protein